MVLPEYVVFRHVVRELWRADESKVRSDYQMRNRELQPVRLRNLISVEAGDEFRAAIFDVGKLYAVMQISRFVVMRYSGFLVSGFVHDREIPPLRMLHVERFNCGSE